MSEDNVWTWLSAAVGRAVEKIGEPFPAFNTTGQALGHMYAILVYVVENREVAVNSGD